MYPALWPDNVRLSDLEKCFVCTACGHRGADVPAEVSVRSHGALMKYATDLFRSVATKLAC